jgi:hypothetical protein
MKHLFLIISVLCLNLIACSNAFWAANKKGLGPVVYPTGDTREDQPKKENQSGDANNSNNSVYPFAESSSSKSDKFNVSPEMPNFQHLFVDSEISGRVAIGDIDNDGFNDIIVHTWGSCRGFHPDGNLYWYKYPNWEKNIIQTNRKYFGDEIVVVDLDNDGDMDIIAPIGQATTVRTCEGSNRSFYGEIYWYENVDGKGTEWKEHFVGLVDSLSEIKDIHVHDMDNDGKLDIAVRASDNIVVFYQNSISSWEKHITPITKREGSCLADIDEDGFMDFVANGYWMKNPGVRNGTWERYNIDELWYSAPAVAPPLNDRWRHDAVRVVAGDFDGDGIDDLVFSHSEHKGFNVTWYKKTGDPILAQTEAWEKHEIGIVDFAHSLQVADFNLNGAMDIMAGATVWRGMLEGTYNPEGGDLVIFLNDGKGNFTRHQIDNKPVYSAIVGDIDNDGDIDIISTRCWDDDDTFDGDVTSIDIWRNLLINDGKQHLNHWTYKEIYNKRKRYDNAQRGNAFLFGLDFGDVNNDGMMDVVAGRELHIAPSENLEGDWTTINLPEPETMDAAFFYDVNKNSRLDIIGFDLMASGSLYWLEATNEEATEWRSHQITLSPAIPVPGHRNPQGFAMAKMMQNGDSVIIIEAGDNVTDDNGIFIIEIEYPATTWSTHKISDVSVGGNGLAVGDIDGDGNLDVFTGYKDLPRRMLDREPGPFPVYWLKNPGVYTQPWESIVVDTFPQGHMPDRFAIADIDNDGINDLIVSEENYPITGGMAAYWYKTPKNPEIHENWGEKRLIISNGESFNSMDVLDMDGDGDYDVVIADMGLNQNGNLYIAENVNNGEFIIHKIHVNVESHGLKAGDLDGDGDMDIVTIAWSRNSFQTLRLWINENFSKKE